MIQVKSNMQLKKGKSVFERIMRHWQLYVLLLPALVYIIIFKYVPMVGVQIAFRDFAINKGFFGSTWVGLKNFITFFHSPYFGRLIGNTLGLSSYSMLMTFIIPIIVALMLNQVKNMAYKRTVQMTLYAPYFISTVIVVTMLYQLLSNYGMLNNLLAKFGLERISFLSIPGLFKTIYVASDVWQTTGYYSVIYLAVLSGVDMSLYDAANVDGASVLQKIRHVEIPCMLPTASILLILGTGTMLNIGFEKVYLMENQMTISSAEIIATYVYKQGLGMAQYSYTAAIGLFNSVISLILLFTVNGVTRKIGETSLF